MDTTSFVAGMCPDPESHGRANPADQVTMYLTRNEITRQVCRRMDSDFLMIKGRLVGVKGCRCALPNSKEDVTWALNHPQLYAVLDTWTS